MAQAQILIVEDESIVAKDIKQRLQNMGYAVAGVVSSGEEAIEKAEKLKPDLVLMDIVLRDKMNGIDAASQIHTRFDVPVIYLTAYADDKTLERVKVTEPFGYIIKPFEDKELRSVVELALYKHGMERKLKESREWLSVTLRSIGDAVIATDTEGCVIFMNLVAEALTGWKEEEAIGKALEKVFNIINEKTGKEVESPVKKVFRENIIVGLANHTLLIAKDGTRRPIDDSGAPIRDEKGNIIGVVLVFHDIAERRLAEGKAKTAFLNAEEEKAKTQAILASIGDALGIVDTDYKIIYQNNISKSMFGDHIGELCYIAYQQKKEVCEGCPVNDAFKDGKVHRVERVKKTEKGTNYYDITVSPLKDQSGNIIGGIEVVRDVTDRKRMEENIYRYGERLRVLCEIDHAILSTRSIDKIIRVALERVMELVPVLRVSLSLFDFDNDRVSIFVALASGKTEVETGTHFTIDEFGISEELLKGKIHVCKDISKTADLSPVIKKLKGEGLRSYINIPIFSLDELLGSLNLGKSTPGAFASEDVLIASEIADLLAVAIQQARNQEELKKSEVKYRDLYDNAPDMYHSIDKDGIIIDCNKTWVKMLGYKKGEIIGKPLVDFFTAKSRELFKKNFPSLARKKALTNIGREFVRKDGTVFPVLLNIFAEMDNNGVLIRTRAIARDISEYKQVERHLKQSIKHQEILHKIDHAILSARPMKETIQIALEGIRALVSCTQASIIFYDLKARNKEIFIVNSKNKTRLKEGMQFPLEDYETIISLNCGEVCVIDNIELFSKPTEFDKLLASDNLRSYINVPLLDLDELFGTLNLGSDRLRAFSANDIKLARELADVLAIVIQSKRSEEALRESEKKYRDIVDNALIGIYKTNLQGDILYVNEVLSNILEFDSPQAMIQSNVKALYKNPGDRGRLIETLKKDSRVDSFEIELITKTGKIKNVLLNARLDNEFLSGMIMDVTEQRLAESAIKESEIFLSSILEGIKDGVVVLAKDLKILFANSSYIEQTKALNMEVRGRHCYEVTYKRDKPCYMDGLECTVKDVFDSGLNIRKIRKKSGRYMEMTVYPLKDSFGKVVSIVEMRRDVTKHVQLDEELKRKMRELEEFYEMAIGRELRMKQLKEEIEELKGKIIIDDK